jgi:hypothetical protein
MRNQHASPARRLGGRFTIISILLFAAFDAHAQSATNFTLGGYAETYYQWNANDPSNDITNFRGFDNRSNSFTLSNLALGANWDDGEMLGRVMLQVGHAPSTYYLAEPALAGAGGANATGPELWKYVQQAVVGYRSQSERAWTVEAGVVLSPVGPEGVAVRDNWNWSRSNLFFGLPFYHTGARLNYPVDEKRTVSFAVFNGWNSVVDNNDEKSLCAQFVYTPSSALTTSLLYFGGVERPAGAPEGRPWRHLFDANATWNASARLSLLAHFDTGFEDTDFGTSSWVAGALYARYQAWERIWLSGRVDAFDETVASNAQGSASAIFWPASWVSSGTLTMDYRPGERVSFRAEYRHDGAESDMFFGDDVTGDGVTTPYVPNRSRQDTITVGAVTWF